MLGTTPRHPGVDFFNIHHKRAFHRDAQIGLTLILLTTISSLVYHTVCKVNGEQFTVQYPRGTSILVNYEYHTTDLSDTSVYVKSE
jgi:uncharacterized membrane protein